MLILDLSLPDGSGFEICKKVRLTSKVSIIFLTASDKDIRHFFILISCVSVGILALLQFMLWLSYRELNPGILLLSLLIVLSILGVCFLYFQKQNQIIEEAIAQIDRYLAGDTDSRIACDEEGSLNKLFHAVNTLATALGAHAAKEQKGKALV